jgi:hypothetical protein
MTAKEILDELLWELPERLRNIRPLAIIPFLEGAIFRVYVAYGLDEAGIQERQWEFKVDLNQPDSLKAMRDWLAGVMDDILCS